jgi:MFS transporter, MCT family, solute carrier family 16 (monocarboxylic acid transporters), member 10
VAGLVYPALVRNLINFIGFQNAQICKSALTAATCLMACALVNPNPNRPVRKEGKHPQWDWEAFSNPSFVCLTVSMCVNFFGFYAVFFSLEEWAVRTRVGRRGDSEAFADALDTWLLLAIMNISSAIGRITAGWAADKHKRWNVGALWVHTGVFFVSSVLLLCFWPFANTAVRAIVFVVLFGAFSGAVIGMPPASMSNVLEAEPNGQAKLGQWTGMMYTCASVFAFPGPTTAGYLIQRYGYNFYTVQFWVGGCLFMAFIFDGAAAFFHRRKTQKLKESSTPGTNQTELADRNDESNVEAERR